ncbi:integrase [Thiospirochaeta perfilievii]|uniref:Integrase n=1 Tax=Thiospirochaeta perfilievii TaxID=252967 RepID=A0A5C1QCF3_9SPIO|nr:tyrosine-type recombinase/integrase [Thiospirochaeta perfilievii]QEN04344.1 integrase [Thiospirochaeta perfilievii]
MQNIITRFQRDLNLRGYSPKTCQVYTSQIVQFLQHTNLSEKIPKAEELKDYLYHLVSEHHLSNSSLKQTSSAIKYLYTQTLGLSWESLNIPNIKVKRKLPVWYTANEVHSILDNAKNLKHKTILTLIYSSGLRLSESVNIKISDVYRNQKRLLVRQGKGGKDRYTILSDRALKLLEQYWLAYKPTTYFFQGRDGKPYSPRSCQQAFYLAKERAGVTRDGGIHGLRHSFATHYLENGGGIFQLQKFLGHKNLTTTLVYAHVLEEKNEIISPLDYYYENSK